MSHGLYFAFFYACTLALFSYLAFWFVPVALRVVYATAKSLLTSERKHDDRHWFDAHHSQ